MQYTIVLWYVTPKQYFGAFFWLKNTHTSHAKIKFQGIPCFTTCYPLENWMSKFRKNKRKQDKFQIIDIKSIQKNDNIMCKSPAKGVLIEWSHNVIFSGQTQKSELEKLGVGQITEVFVSNSWSLVACKTGAMRVIILFLGLNAIPPYKIDFKVEDHKI